jgi:hypothetical protein
MSEERQFARTTDMQQPQSKNWWGRNWKWFVPVGCLSSLVLVIGFIALIVFFVSGMVKSSDVYNQALSRARHSPEVIQSLGTPIEEGFFTSGSINMSDSSGEAELAIPISGPVGNGTIYVEARKSMGEWTFLQLVVEVEQTGEGINLLNN